MYLHLEDETHLGADGEGVIDLQQTTVLQLLGDLQLVTNLLSVLHRRRRDELGGEILLSRAVRAALDLSELAAETMRRRDYMRL